MRLFMTGPGMRDDTERAVEGAMQAVASLEEACRAQGVQVTTERAFVLVFSPDDNLHDVVHVIMAATKPPVAKAS